MALGGTSTILTCDMTVCVPVCQVVQDWPRLLSIGPTVALTKLVCAEALCYL